MRLVITDQHHDLALSCEIHTSFEEMAHARDEWDRFVSEIGGDIYFSYDWCRLWWKHYGSDRSLRLFVFRAEGKLAGIMPMFMERLCLGGAWLRMAKVVGSDSALCICNPPVTAEHAPAVLASVMRVLVENDRCDTVLFGPLPYSSPVAADIRAICGASGGTLKVLRDVSPGPHTMFNLPTSFDDYLASLDKHQRGNYRRDLRLLATKYRIDVSTITDPAAAEAEFDRFRLMHDAQWHTENKLGHFGDWPGAIEFNREQVQTQARLGRLRLFRLLANEEVVSYQLCYVFGDCCYWRLPARVSGAEWDRHGLGRIGLVKMIEAAIGEGVRRIEAGVGHYDYKLRCGGAEAPLQSILVVSNHPWTRCRARAFCAWADLLHLLYYRIWFGRVTPRLPFQRQPLWKCWIRSRI